MAKFVNLKKRSSVRENKMLGIDSVYHDESNDDVMRINQPSRKIKRVGVFNKMNVTIFLIILIFGIYLLYFRSQTPLNSVLEERWYQIKLTNGEIFFGQIADTGADPVIVKNVYYDYDQQIKAEKPVADKNLRLVKKGQETYGPEGSLDIVRAQVLYMEQLKEDSKVLEAIEVFENQ